MKKRLAIDDVRPGMYLVDIDRSWLESPFLWHRFRIKAQGDIDKLKACGVREVWIDPGKSAEEGFDPDDDVTVPPETAATGASPNVQEKQECEPDSGCGEARTDGQAKNTDRKSQTSYLVFTKDLSDWDDARASGAAAKAGERGDGRAIDRLFSEVEEEEKEMAMVRQVLRDASVAVENVFEGAKTGAPINAAQTRDVVNGLLKQVLTTQRAMFQQIQIQAIRQFDATLYTHVLDVAVLAMVLGKEGGCDHVALFKLGMGALLHDVGQMRIPRNLYRKQGRLTGKERKLMQKHPELGVALLSNTPDIPEDVRRIVAEHHERVDGSGYPGKLVGAQLSPLSQIVGIADCYDGMLRRRGDRPALPPAQAVRELFRLGKNHQYDPIWTDRLIHLVGVYPLGSLVKLQTGEQAVVLKENSAHRTRPMVRIISSEQGRHGLLLDLAQPETTSGDTICEVLDPVKEQVDVAEMFV